ncbi:MAG: hypothetical protein MHPSP_004473, partial [Paramarteilia canceri]
FKIEYVLSFYLDPQFHKYMKLFLEILSATNNYLQRYFDNEDEGTIVNFSPAGKRCMLDELIEYQSVYHELKTFLNLIETNDRAAPLEFYEQFGATIPRKKI